MRFFSFAIAFLLLFVVSVGSGAEHTKDSLDTVRQNLAQKKAVLVDVRELKEWEQGHLADAQRLSLSELKPAAQDQAAKETLSKRLPNDKIIYCHCAKGVRAVMAGNILEKLGYDVRPLSAGYDELRSAAFPEAKK